MEDGDSIRGDEDSEAKAARLYLHPFERHPGIPGNAGRRLGVVYEDISQLPSKGEYNGGGKSPRLVKSLLMEPPQAR